ncbi:hypothetical protein niasHS_003642 [Heterodera schachtii]|uniref:Methanethiol oxidase n=1 Tax=Heterodera schachtii TaxID=97005 RepID=A0ABD2KHK1_HETSC
MFVALPNCSSPRNPLATYPDCIASLDINPDSQTYGKLISVLEMPNEGDELNNLCCCSSDRLIVTSIGSGRIYVVDTSDPKELKLEKTIEPSTLTSLGVSCPGRVCCASDSVIIGTMGDDRMENNGNFLLLDRLTFEPIGFWAEKEGQKGTKFGGTDFCIQTKQNVLLSVGWGTPAKFRGGLRPRDVTNGHYSNEVNVWEWRQRRLIQTIALEGDCGWMPMAVRFLHNADKCHAFVCTLLGSAIYHLWREEGEESFRHCLAAHIPPKKVDGWQCPSFVPQFVQDLLVSMNWALPKMPAFTSDLVISSDDRFLFTSNWLHGDVRQWDISDPFNIKMVAQCFVGGSLLKGSGVTICEDEQPESQPEAVQFENGQQMLGGPHKLKLSPDGRCLYVTNSLYYPWDVQFYPKLAEEGSTMVQLDVVTSEGGGLKVNSKFCVRFDHSDELPKGPYLAREMLIKSATDQ